MYTLLARCRPRLLAEHAAILACLALPPALLHARALAEILIVAIDVLFLLHAWTEWEWDWVGAGFTRAAALWWVWLVVCSLLGAGFPLALAAIRLPLLALALGWWLLPGRERAMQAMLLAAFVWIGIECWHQSLLGHNVFGQARWIDGALTGPFNKPRAGPAFILLFFPVVVPATLGFLGWRGLARPAAGFVVLGISVLTMLLIGQRMPILLTALGLGVAALLLKPLRPAVLAAGLAGVLAVAALPVVSPGAHAKLVLQTRKQFAHVGNSDYGLILARAVGVAREHPWTGLGFDGFRRACAAELREPTWTRPEVAPARLRACNLHPHNYYLEAADDAGLPGLLAFSAMAWAALAGVGAGLWPPAARRADPRRVGAFVGVLVALFPLATTSAFTSMPNGGWVFLVIGLGLALSRGTPMHHFGASRRAAPS